MKILVLRAVEAGTSPEPVLTRELYNVTGRTRNACARLNFHIHAFTFYIYP